MVQMAKKFYETREFKKLNRDWRAILKEDGFIDIEENGSEREYLKRWEGQYFHKHYNHLSFFSKHDYYNCAARFFETHHFKTELDKEIWRLHSSGETLRAIAKEVDTLLSRVRTTVDRHRKCMLGII